MEHIYLPITELNQKVSIVPADLDFFIEKNKKCYGNDRIKWKRATYYDWENSQYNGLLLVMHLL